MNGLVNEIMTPTAVSVDNKTFSQPPQLTDGMTEVLRKELARGTRTGILTVLQFPKRNLEFLEEEIRLRRERLEAEQQQIQGDENG